MKLQHLISKVEELKAVVGLYEQVQQALGQGVALQASLEPDVDAEQRKTVDDTVASVESRMATITTLLCERTGAADIDEAVERVQHHIARLQQHQQIRSDQLQLRTQLDLELAMGGLEAEVRQQAENKIQAMQARLEMLVRQGEQALRGPSLITLS